MYYFKEPKEKYPWEFWNEIIASVVGKELGFNVLDYKPAVLDGIGGCLSPSMTEEIYEELIHGQQFLIRILPEFETKKGTDHTFQLVEEFFNSSNGHQLLLEDFVEMLVFDAIIGNRDRHQQNWAIIREIKMKPRSFKLNIFPRQRVLPLFEVKGRFSPFFDNGNCLAYNIIEDKINNYLSDNRVLEKYLFGEKSVSHVKWYGASLPHIDLLKKLYPKYKQPIDRAISRVREKYNESTMLDLINTIDNGIIFANDSYNLTPKRKELFFILIKLRIEKILTHF